MEEKIKYIYWSGQVAVFEHYQFFNDMRHRAEWGKQHKDGNNDEN